MLKLTSRYQAQTLPLGALGIIMADQIDERERHLQRIAELTRAASNNGGGSALLGSEPTV
ncbi:hypothetical protein [Actinoplanes sp. NPDC020271]|uniref:hypothetical protein n=1 Tax=Actinoplanes sp. NPDC020271 TaxID=3363896 RepID=UPI00379589CF